MGRTREIYADLFKEASASEEIAFVKEALGTLGSALLLSGAGLGGGLIGSAIGKHRGQREAEKDLTKQKALAFGAGALSGLIAPTILSKLKSAVGMGLGPNNTSYDEFSEI